jgi:hypothetical protein
MKTFTGKTNERKNSRVVGIDASKPKAIRKDVFEFVDI